MSSVGFFLSTSYVLIGNFLLIILFFTDQKTKKVCCVIIQVDIKNPACWAPHTDLSNTTKSWLRVKNQRK